MLMDTILFYAFAALVLGGGILTITRRNAVHSAISLIVSLLGVAGLYLLQQAEFLFAVQIVLYVGGIMVLFLFVIMLVNLDQDVRTSASSTGEWLVALAAVALVGAEIAYFLYRGRGRVPRRGERRRRRCSPCRQHRNAGRFAVLRIPAAVRDRLAPAAGGGGRLRGDGQEEDLTMHPVTTVHYLALSAALLLIGTVGVLTRRNIVIILMSIELILNAVNINLVAFSHALANINGQIFAIFVITDAVAEAAVGLGILIALFRNKETVQADEIDLLKW